MKVKTKAIIKWLSSIFLFGSSWYAMLAYANMPGANTRTGAPLFVAFFIVMIFLITKAYYDLGEAIK